MRKLFSIIMALLATTCLWAYDFQSGDLYYNITSDTTVEVTSQSTSFPYNEGVTFTTVTIPETVTSNGTTYSITSIGDYAFRECPSLTNITIPNSVTSIGTYAFHSSTSLTSITIPDRVTSIGNYAFSYCISLISISIPNSITNIGKSAFNSCSSLTSITIPSSVTNIGERAFYGCSSLSSLVVEIGNTIYDSRDNCNAIIETATNTLIAGCQNTIIPNSVTNIGDHAFDLCQSLTSITIPNSVTSIGKWAFSGCSSLTSITIPNSVTSIGESAFSSCGTLSSVTIGNSVSSIGNSAFSTCDALTSMVVEEGNTTYDSRDNCNAIIETATNTLLAGCQNTIIPNSVTSIGNSAFFGCSSLTSITIPSSVTNIGERAFYGCSSLTSVTIPNSVTSIGDNAFSWCESLITIKTEAITPPTLENNVFNGCDKLSAIYIPDNTLSAYQQAWGDEYTYINNENALNIHVEVPGTLEDLISNTGANPTLVTRLTLTGTLNDDDFTCMRETMSSLVDIDLSRILNTSGVDFYNKDELVRVVLPNTLEHIGEYAFWGCSLTSITIPNSVTSIGVSAFFGCSSLVTLIVEEGNSIYDSRDNCNAVIETATNTLIAGCNKTTIPKSVTNIGESAFYNCYKLTSITIPNSVTSIGDYAFSGCWGLNSVTIGNNITNIRNGAFSGCSSLTSITIPNSVTSIGFFAFNGCSSLTSITIPNSVTSIGLSAFNGCSSLTSVVVEKGNPTYDSRENCNAIIETATNTLIAGCGNTNIPNSIASIGESAFSECSTLTSIIIPSSVTSIGNNVFSSCFNLTSMVVEDGNTTYDSRDNCNAIIETATNTLIAGCGNTAIPNSVTSIGYGAFRDCNALSVTIPHSITSIGAYAFHSCSSLTSITIPNSVISIGDYAFAYSYDLDTIRVEATTPPILGSYVFSSTPTSFCYIPCGKKTAYEASDWAQYVGEFVEECDVDSTMIITYTSTDSNVVTPYNAEVFGANIVSNTYENGVGTITFDAPITSFGNYAFYQCSSLTSVTIPNSVTSIGNYAFQYCSSLTSITIPNSVTSIGDGAFSVCSSLTSMVVESGNSTYDSRNNCNAIIETATNTLIAGCQNTIIPNSVTSIGNSAFSGCSSLDSVTIPNSVTSIGGWAFSGCSSLTSITIPNGVTSIGDCAFYYCSSLTSITIPNSVTSIGYNAFYYCSKLTSITIPNSVTSIGRYAFSFCSSLTSVTIPNSVTSIGERAFSECSSLTSMVVESGNSIYDSRNNCNAIIETATNTLIAGCQNTIIPNSVTSIGEAAFRACFSLTAITIPNSVTSIGDDAFLGCTSLTSITIPNSVTTIGNYAFSSCRSLTSITIPNSVTSIGYSAFEYCSSLTSITIPNSVTSIGRYTFSYCSSLTSITIPNSVTSIGERAFRACSSLDTIYLEATTPPTIESNTFTNTPAPICYIPCGTKSAYEASAWAQYMGEFVEDCDNKCGNQLYWEYSDTQLSITGYGDMYDYDIEPQPWQQHRNKITQISLPEGMTSIGASAFAECKYVKSVTIPSTVEKIYDSAFEDCRMLATLTFAEPSALISIGNWAFYNNHELKSVVIPDGVTEIGYAAFYGCTYLDELTLPASMEYIADNSFALCAKLRRMNVSAAIPPVVEARTFEDVDRSIPVVVPDASVNQYKAAPIWQEFNIIGKNSVSTSVDNVDTSTCGVEKLLRDGQLIILRDGKEYNVMGQEL